ncbi:stage II sporulation protein M [Clostridium sp. CAG:793]|nr:stage II sporulation protein M [Clostridium sp. CAG:793]
MRKAIERHIQENIKEYFILFLVLLMGILIGTFVLNNSGDEQKSEIIKYITDFNSSIKSGNKIDYACILKENINKNIKTILLMAFLSISIIGILGTYIFIGYKGFCIGYSISAVIMTLGIGKGMLFTLSIMLVSKIIEIPALLMLAVAGMKMYKSIVQDRENFKQEIVKYLIYVGVAIFLLAISVLLETYLSSNLYISISKYI